MPTYEYHCLDCQYQYEKREGFEAPALQVCPACGGTARRVLQATPVLFKGSGFYVTDSRKSSPDAESAAKVESAETSSTPGKTEPAKTEPSKDAEPAAAEKPAAAS